MVKLLCCSFIVILLFLANFSAPVQGIQDVPDTLTFVQQLGNDSERLYSPSWSFDGNYLAVQGQGIVSIWDSETWEIIISISCTPLSSGFWSPIELTIVISCYGVEQSFEVLDVDTQVVVRILSNPPLAWSPDGSLIATRQDDTTLGIIDAITGNILYRYGSPCNPSLAPVTTEIGGCGISYPDLAWSSGGRYISWLGGDMTGRNIEILDLGVKPNTQRFDGADDILWLLDGNRFILNKDGWLEIWDISNFQIVNSIEITAYALQNIPNSNFIAICSIDSHLMLLDITNGQLKNLQMKSLTDQVTTCGFRYIEWASNGLVAIPQQDGTIQIWQAE